MTKAAADGLTQALLQRMGSHERSWAYAHTLARVAGGAPEAVLATLASLEQEGLVVSEQAPTGPRYRLSDRGVERRDQLRRAVRDIDG